MSPKRSKQEKEEQVLDEPKDPKRSLLETRDVFSPSVVFKAMIGVLRLRAFRVLEVKQQMT